MDPAPPAEGERGSQKDAREDKSSEGTLASEKHGRDSGGLHRRMYLMGSRGSSTSFFPPPPTREPPKPPPGGKRRTLLPSSSAGVAELQQGGGPHPHPRSQGPSPTDSPLSAPTQSDRPVSALSNRQHQPSAAPDSGSSSPVHSASSRSEAARDGKAPPPSPAVSDVGATVPSLILTLTPAAHGTPSPRKSPKPATPKSTHQSPSSPSSSSSSSSSSSGGKFLQTSQANARSTRHSVSVVMARRKINLPSPRPYGEKKRGAKSFVPQRTVIVEGTPEFLDAEIIRKEKKEQEMLEAMMSIATGEKSPRIVPKEETAEVEEELILLDDDDEEQGHETHKQCDDEENVPMGVMPAEKEKRRKGKKGEEREKKRGKEKKKKKEGRHALKLIKSFHSVHMDRTAGVLCSVATEDLLWVSYSSGRISLFDRKTFEEKYTLSHPLKERAYVLLAGEEQVFMISEQGKIAVWNAETRTLEGFFRTDHTTLIKHAAIIDDMIWTADVDGFLQMWGMDTFDVAVQCNLPGPVLFICPTPWGVWLTGLGEIFFLQREGDQYLEDVMTCKAHANSKINSAVCVKDRGEVWTCADDTMICVWDARTMELLHTLADYKDRLYALALTEDGKRVLAGGFSMEMIVFDVNSRAVIQKLKRHTDSVRSIFAAPGGNVWSGSRDGLICVWRLARVSPSSSKKKEKSKSSVSDVSHNKLPSPSRGRWRSGSVSEPAPGTLSPRAAEVQGRTRSISIGEKSKSTTGLLEDAAHQKQKKIERNNTLQLDDDGQKQSSTSTSPRSQPVSPSGWSKGKRGERKGEHAIGRRSPISCSEKEE